MVKPAHGSGGNGILVVGDRSGERLVKSSGQEITFEDLEFHISNVLSGMYSLGGHPDAAMIEYRVAFDPLFEDIAYRGVPDIRTLVFRGVPVMAMVRLPTRASDGRANLHQGAVGAGIDLASGPHDQRRLPQPDRRERTPTPTTRSRGSRFRTGPGCSTWPRGVTT